MSEIVARLRQWSEFGYGAQASEDMKKAAARIEALKEALREIIDLGGAFGSAEYARRADAIARATLEAKP